MTANQQGFIIRTLNPVHNMMPAAYPYASDTVTLLLGVKNDSRHCKTSGCITLSNSIRHFLLFVKNIHTTKQQNKPDYSHTEYFLLADVAIFFLEST